MSRGIVLAAGALLVTGMAAARIVKNTIEATAVLETNGKRLIVTGPLSCTEEQMALVRVTVTQRSTGAVAQGYSVLECTETETMWEVRAYKRGRNAFAEGPATAVAVALSREGGTVDDAHQWLVDITLAKK
jgi:hypothetical protein